MCAMQREGTLSEELLPIFYIFRQPTVEEGSLASVKGVPGVHCGWVVGMVVMMLLNDMVCGEFEKEERSRSLLQGKNRFVSWQWNLP
jgi:hypothetical protein